MKRITALILSILIIVTCFAACGKTDNGEEDTSITYESVENTGNLKLAYSKSDSLNPYTCETTINLQITNLIFDGLYRLDSEYKPQPVIARSSILSGRTINVTINQVKFSDGTPLTVEDVIYSYNIAKESSTYSERLKNFVSITVSSSDMFIFNLEKPDPYAVSCLDFPIVKQTSEEGVVIGSGRYKVADNKDSKYLIVNTDKAGFNPAVKTILLEAIHDSDSAESNLVIGNTAFFYDDLSDGEFNRINARNNEVGLNNFVFLGMNPHCPFFETAAARQALSYALDREKICINSFCNHARQATLPFNPDWYALSSYTSSVTYDKEKAAQLIEEADIDTKSRELILLYNNENGFKADAAKKIKENLEDAGFIVRLYGVEAQYFADEIKYGNYDLYIGEIKLTANMNLDSFFDSSFYGYSPYSECVEKYISFTKGECEIMDFINSFNDDVPFIPLCFRNAVVSYTNAITADYNCSESDVFYDIESWRIK